MGTVFFRLPEWIAATRLSRSLYYSLPPAIKPKTLKLGRALIITESPEAWAKRVRRATAQDRAA